MKSHSPILDVTGITRRHAAALPPVVRDITFQVQPGEMFALLGPSGCGKTSFLRVLAGFDPPESGVIRYGGRLLNGPHTEPVPPEKRGIGIVFQDYALFPHLTAAQNIGFGLKGRIDRKKEAALLLATVGLEGLGHRYPHELSGGQQQRVAIARSMAPRPSLILLDEPFSNLDAKLRHSTRAEVKAMLAAFGITAIMVTHDQEEALSFADRIAVMRDGRIQQTGTPEDIYFRPRTPFVAQFLGLTNLVLAHADGLTAETGFGPIALDRACSGPTWVSLRPEHLTLAAPGAPGTIRGVILRREFKGHDVTWTVKTANAEVLVHTDNRLPFACRDEVAIIPLEAAIVLEDEPAGVCE